MCQSTNLVVWLTKKEVCEAAMKGPIAARECSILHWMQIRDAGLDEYLKAKDDEFVSTTGDYCALCRHYNSCSACPIHDVNFICCKEFTDARMQMSKDIKKARREWSLETIEAINKLIEKIDKSETVNCRITAGFEDLPF